MKKATLSILALGLLATGATYGQTMNSSGTTTTTTTTNRGSNNTVSAETTGTTNNMGNANGSPTNLNNSSTTGGNYQSTTPATGGSTTTGVNGGYNGTTNGTYNGTMNNTTGTANGTMNNTTGNGSYNSGTGSMNNSSTTTGTYSTSTDTYNSRPAATMGYKALTFGIYAGLNSTRLRGETPPNGRDLSGRLGYQLGAFIRGGGRVYGQIGAEYLASSSRYFVPGDGQNVRDIEGQIDQKYLQIPALVGVKLTQSDRGISAVRLAVGLEYANRLSGSNTVNINEREFRSGQWLGLVNLGFDAGPVFLDFMYHYGFANTINGFNNSDRRILSANFGFKF